MKRVIRSVMALALWCNGWLIASCATEHDFQTWMNATVIGSFHANNKEPNHLKYWLEGQERLGDDSARFMQTLLRTGLGYALNDSTSVWLGYAWVATGAPLTSSPFAENRVWQQLLWIKKSQRGILTSRTRTEQRFLENNPKTAYRARQLLKWSVPFTAFPRLSWVTSDELFWHKNNFIGKNSSGFDQNRFFIGFGYQFKQGVTSEVGYMNQSIRRFGVPNFVANILSINLFIFY